MPRIFNCLLLFDWVPPPLIRYPWFTVEGTPDQPDLSSAILVDPQWEYYDTFQNIDWRAPDAEPIDITLSLMALKVFWAKLSQLCKFDMLNASFTDPARLKGYWESGKQNVFTNVNNLMKAKYGPDAEIVLPDDPTHPVAATPSSPSSANRPKSSKISSRLTAKWHLEGWISAYNSAIRKLSNDLSSGPSHLRFFRAFQFFTHAFRVPDPHRYVALSISLESLLCTQRSEVTFQLAGRAAWIIDPSHFDKRKEVFSKVKHLYDFRSKIVHGVHYPTKELDESKHELTTLIRKAFFQILSSDKLWGIFSNTDDRICRSYLDNLNLGVDIGPDTSPSPQ
jgi:hypothetical protein